MLKDYYDILGVQETATGYKIKRPYPTSPRKKLALLRGFAGQAPLRHGSAGQTGSSRVDVRNQST